MKNIIPQNGMVITENTRFEPGVYTLPDGISIGTDNLTLDGNTAQIVGRDHQGVGVNLDGFQNITIKNMQISGYQFGIRAVNCLELTIKHCRVFDTGLFSPASGKASYWIPLEKNNGCAVLLAGVRDGHISNNDFQHQSTGFSAYSCQGLRVEGNNTSHNAMFGVYLFDTSSSKFINNLADNCSGSSTRPTSFSDSEIHSAGFLFVNNSKNNHFIGNSARHCPFGFLLYGLSPDNDHFPCSRNMFEQNDAAHCITSAFYDAFNQKNTFNNNHASHSGYGFLMKFVTDDEYRENIILGNHRAGIGAENSIHCDVLNNTIQDNRFGIQLWMSPENSHQHVLPKNDTSKFWLLESNTIHRNGTGIRIAAYQEAGMILQKPIPGKPFSQFPKPHDHEIFKNVISENRLGIQTIETERTVIKDNHFELNLQGDIKS